MTDEQMWKRRFLLFTLVRLSGLLIILFGLAVALSDVVTPGGWKLGGAALIAIGTIEMVVFPLLLRRAWERK